MSNIRVQLDFTIPGVPFRLVAVAGLLLLLARELASENVQLTTYYPAPSGVYTQMVTTANTYLARDTAVAGSSLGSAVGIGTTNLGSLLSVTGNWKNTAAPGNANVTIGFGYDGVAAPANGLIVQGSSGIGTKTPKNQLDVGPTAAGITGAAAFGAYAGANAAPANGIIVSGQSGVGTATPKNEFDVAGAAAFGTYAGVDAVGANGANGIIVSGRSAFGSSSIPGAPAGPQVYVQGGGGGTVDLQVTGRIQTGDAGNEGGIWLDDGQNIFAGEVRSGVPGGPATDEIGFWTAAAGWGVQIPQKGYIYIDNAATACGAASSPMNDVTNGWVAVCAGGYATFNQGLYLEGESIQNVGNPYYNPSAAAGPGSPGQGVLLENGIQVGTVSYLCCAK